MKATDKHWRVFISSTSLDLKAERGGREGALLYMQRRKRLGDGGQHREAM